MFESITSLQNDRVKNLVRLRDGHHRRRQGRFIIEGFRELERALQSNWPCESLFFCEEFFKDPEAYSVLERAESCGLEILRLGKDAFSKVAFRQNPDGLLATAKQVNRELDELNLSTDCLLVALEAVEKPGNIGAVLRTANAAGADAVILIETVCDPYNPQTIRSSQGAFFHIPFVQTSSSDLADFLRKREIFPVITSPRGQKVLWEADLKAACTLILGSEDKGLSPFWVERRETFALPMQGLTDSLNVSAMAAVGLFEAVRQRQNSVS